MIQRISNTVNNRLSSAKRFRLDSAASTAASMLLLLIIVGVVGRLGAYWSGAWNFTPVASVGLFAGFYFRRKSIAVIAPLAVMLVSNVLIGSYESTGMLLAVYASLLLPVFLSTFLRQDLSAVRVGLCAASSSVSFFLITNFSHWVFMRTHTFANLLSCYAEALPFFRPTLAGDLIWSSVIFGSYALATWNGFAPRRAQYVRIPK